MENKEHAMREEFLSTVCNLVNGQREKEYGTAKENFRRIAMMWTAYLGQYVDERDVAACLAMLKIARIATSKKHADSWIDLAGYATLGGTLE